MAINVCVLQALYVLLAVPPAKGQAHPSSIILTMGLIWPRGCHYTKSLHTIMLVVLVVLVTIIQSQVSI